MDPLVLKHRLCLSSVQYTGDTLCKRIRSRQDRGSVERVRSLTQNEGILWFVHICMCSLWLQAAPDFHNLFVRRAGIHGSHQSNRARFAWPVRGTPLKSGPIQLRLSGFAYVYYGAKRSHQASCWCGQLTCGEVLHEVEYSWVRGTGECHGVVLASNSPLIEVTASAITAHWDGDRTVETG